ncbi:hypothetical protein N7462_004939 [Penicillium macrosclerotiorum]|uniref:uncharacterized protein n=1 Tax=Penicillium macrosclerotiorum TaxID=303699 RepID=UPI0025499B6C|nr:uncharacterized protein N7462_004939 [Penicillium macrosclerotiorum]KAJ5690547.1 hypothetical protein N7462_004939 [Penicillium macrosclerotiorum]
MPAKVNKPKASPRKNVDRAQASNDANLLLMWACYSNNGGGAIDWAAVCESLNITQTAAKTRYHRLRTRMIALMEARKVEDTSEEAPRAPEEQAVAEDSETRHAESDEAQG